MSTSQISTEALEALERLCGDTSARANVERAYWELVLTDDSVDLVKRDGVWEMLR